MWSGAKHLAVPAALALALALAAAATGPRAQEAGFVGGVEDLPLMPGLAEIEDAGVAFDKPAGRIVETYAQGEVEREAVLAFYRSTLPQLGWQVAGAAQFRRENERLSLEFLDGGGPLVVRFSLIPE